MQSAQTVMESRRNAFVYDEGASGRCHDKETGSFYNYFRDYDPSIGRYTTFDPIGLAGGLNGYIYVGNDPTNYVDPLGLREMYGNWGGSKWSGGKSSPRIPANPLAPTDSLDACFMTHDGCYQNNEDSGQCFANGPSKKAEKSCDMALLQCMANLPSNTNDWSIPPKNLVYGNNQHSPTADNFRSQANTYFRWKWRQ